MDPITESTIWQVKNIGSTAMFFTFWTRQGLYLAAWPIFFVVLSEWFDGILPWAPYSRIWPLDQYALNCLIAAVLMFGTLWLVRRLGQEEGQTVYFVPLRFFPSIYMIVGVFFAAAFYLFQYDPDRARPIAVGAGSEGARAVAATDTPNGTPVPAISNETSLRREDARQAALIAMLRAPEGATMQEITAATGWRPDRAQDLMAGLAVRSEKTKERGLVYRLSAD